MPFEVVVVLILVAAAMVAMVIYVRVFLPRKMRALYRDSLEAFAAAVELRFPGNRGSTEAGVELAAQIGRQLRLSGVELERLEMAGYLRDIGLSAIPYQLVNAKRIQEWDQGDIDTFDRHPEVSGAMLELVPSLRHLAPIVRHHHARFDSLEFIPLEARVLCVASEYVFQASRHGHLEAVEHLREHSGTRFDPLVVQAALTVLTSPRAEFNQRAAVAS